MIELCQYTGNDEDDSLLIQWWARAREAGELGLFFHAESNSVRDFLNAFQQPTQLLLGIDDKGIALGGWFDPQFSGAFFGLWTRPDCRKTLAQFRIVERMLEMGLKSFPVLFGVTKQKSLLDVHRRLGYTVLAEVPGLWAGETAWVVMLTPDGFANRKARRDKKWARQKNRVAVRL